jgi:hypothetical protein
VECLARAGVHKGKADPVLVQALKDRRATLRGAAALVLGRAREARQQTAVRPLLKDADSRVRLRAAQGLVAGRDREAVPILVALLTEAPPDLAREAEDLLLRVAGANAPSVLLSTGNDEERRKCRQAWDAWYRTHGIKLDLAGIDIERRTLGLTLIAAVNGYGGNGVVQELGPDRKVRWQLKQPHGPFDAQVVSANRVLVAEYNAGRVTERDLAGKVLWEYRTPQSPICCQRLSGGNTLITTNHEIMEVTPAGKVVFSRKITNGLYFSAQKIRNGHLLFGTYEGQVAELDEHGKELRSFKIPRPDSGLVTIEVLPGGRYLIPQTGAGKLVEYDGTGKVMREIAVPSPCAAVRLPNGHTLVSSHVTNRVLELDRAGKVVWEQQAEGQVFRVRSR